MTEKECSICKVKNKPLKQLNLPMPPWRLFYCKLCWTIYTDLIKNSAKEKKAKGKSLLATANEIIKEISEKK